MKKFTTTFFLLMAMVLLLPTELKAADVTLTFLVPQTNKGARLHAWLDDSNNANDVAFWKWENNPTVGTNDGNGNFSGTVSYKGTDYYSLTKTVGNNNNLNKIAAILIISDSKKELTPVNVSDFSKVKYVIVTESAITVENNEGGSADASYYLIGEFNNWDTSNTDYNFTVDAANKKATATIPASAFSSNGVDTEVYFAVNAIKNGSDRWYLRPSEKIEITEGSQYSISSDYNNNLNNSFCFKNPATSSTEIYTITLDFSSTNNINHSKLTITKSGSGGGEGEDDDLNGFVPGATSNGNAYYLASKDGNLFNQTLVKPSENTIKYNRILRFDDKGNGTYTVDIPATVTGDLYIEEVDKDNNVVAYYPTSSNKTISASVPANNAEVVGKLVTDLNYWAMTDRSGQNDGLYTITLTLGKDGKPGKWSFKHDAARRVAYFFSTAENSSAYPVYSDITSNKFIGYNYFDPTGVAKYYVISNITMNTYETIEKAKQLDPTLVTLSDGSPTVNKLMIMGNGGQKFRDDGTSDFDPAYEHKANEMSPDSEPMIADSKLQGLCQVEYNPSNGDNNGAVLGNRYGMRGQIQVKEGGSAGSIMTIVGPLVEKSVSGETWNWTYAVDGENVMKYNAVENCYEITITTKKDQEGKEFRFVQDKTATKSWGETGKIARIPYYDTTKEEHAATVADPNDVGILAPEKDNILFNRPAGKWTIKFYFVNHADETTSYYYTINGEDNFTVIIPEVPAKDGKRYVLRTFSYGADMTPTDAGVHIYVAHSFSATPENGKKLSTGQVKLYEINYVPANTGVVLFCKDKTGEQRVNFVPSNAYNTKNYPIKEMKDRWTCDHSREEYHNDLQPVLVQETFGPSVFAENGKTIIKRNFGLGLFSTTTIFTHVDADDYIGFFRLINWVGDNKAFLQYGTDVIANNAQAFGQTTDQVQLEGATINSKLALVFEGFNDFDDSETTGIKDTITEVGNNGDNSYYNLQGIKVATPVKGIYIHNGKKVIIK